jgi:pilus assembly protein CpaF
LPADAATLTQHAFSAVAGFGPLQSYFDDPTVEELWIIGRLTREFA